MQINMSTGIDQPRLGITVHGPWNMKDADAILEYCTMVRAVVIGQGIIPGFLPADMAYEIGIVMDEE